MTHNRNKRRSTKEKHQKGQTPTKAGKENTRWKKYKKQGGKASKNSWKKNGG